MGCDVHMHLEIKVDGQWQHYAAPQIDRNYTLFGILAGVRGPGPAVVEPRGLPDDVSVVTHLAHMRYGPDAHTPSWFSAEEIVKFEDAWALAGEHVLFEGRPVPAFSRDVEHTLLHTYLFGNSWGGWQRWPNDRPKGVEDVRWVFWFDS